MYLIQVYLAHRRRAPQDRTVLRTPNSSKTRRDARLAELGRLNAKARRGHGCHFRLVAPLPAASTLHASYRAPAAPSYKSYRLKPDLSPAEAVSI